MPQHDTLTITADILYDYFQDDAIRLISCAAIATSLARYGFGHILTRYFHAAAMIYRLSRSRAALPFNDTVPLLSPLLDADI